MGSNRAAIDLDGPNEVHESIHPPPLTRGAAGGSGGSRKWNSSDS